MQIFTKYFNKTLLTTCAFLITFALSTAVPIPAKFFVNTFDAEVGQTVEFELRIEGSESAPVYTVVSNLEYDKNLLTFNSATVQQGWVTVAPDDVTDRANGVIKRTAGYPSGLKTSGSFYKYSFTAKAPGDATVRILGSSAYDANNNDLGVQNKTITVKIGGEKKPVEPKPEPTESVQKPVEKPVTQKPQTISTSFAGNVGFDSSKDYSFLLRYDLKEKQSTSGSSTVSFVNAAGQSVWSVTREFNFTDSSELLLTVPANTLDAGNYVMSIDTRYEGQKTSSKITKEVGAVPATEKMVNKEVPKPYIPVYVYIAAGVMVFWYVLTLTYYRSKKFKKFLKNF